MIDRLAARGLVERGGGVDRRIRGLRLTDAGGKVWESLNAARTAWLERALGELDCGQLAHLEPAVEALLAVLTTSYDESEHIGLGDERACPRPRCPVTLTVERIS